MFITTSRWFKCVIAKRVRLLYFLPEGTILFLWASSLSQVEKCSRITEEASNKFSFNVFKKGEILVWKPLKPIENTRTSMPVEALLTIANKCCSFTLPGRLSKTSLLPYLTLELATWRCLLYWTLTSLLRRIYNSNDTHFARLIKRQMNQFSIRKRLRQLGEHCDFDKAIKDQLIEHCHSNTLRWCLLLLQTANIENASSQEHSEFVHQLTTPTFSDEEQANFTSDNRQQFAHCSNQPNHQSRTPDALLFVRHAPRAEPYTILDLCVQKEPQIQVTQMAQRQGYPRPGMFVTLRMRMKAMRHFNSTLTKQSQISQLPSKVPQSNFVFILVPQSTPLTTQHTRQSVLQKQYP